MVKPGAVEDLGTVAYQQVHARQLEVLDQRKRGEGVDRLLLVEHPHVITVGRTRAALANVVRPGEVEVVEIERGGDVTYHGPGQLVAYPIVALDEDERDLHRFLRNLEEGIMRTAAEFGIESERAPGKTGVWIGPRKLASIGIACRRWVTFHGLALNVNTELDYFHRINPCGFAPEIMTSMARELDRDSIDMASVKRALAKHLGEVLGRDWF